jgi:hypothetical protein
MSCRARGDPERAGGGRSGGQQGWQHRLGRPAILLHAPCQATVVQGCDKPGARGAPLMPPPSAVHAADIEGEGEEKSLRDLSKPVRRAKVTPGRVTCPLALPGALRRRRRWGWPLRIVSGQAAGALARSDSARSRRVGEDLRRCTRLSRAQIAQSADRADRRSATDRQIALCTSETGLGKVGQVGATGVLMLTRGISPAPTRFRGGWAPT